MISHRYFTLNYISATYAIHHSIHLVQCYRLRYECNFAPEPEVAYRKLGFFPSSGHELSIDTLLDSIGLIVWPQKGWPIAFILWLWKMSFCDQLNILSQFQPIFHQYLLSWSIFSHPISWWTIQVLVLTHDKNIMNSKIFVTLPSSVILKVDTWKCSSKTFGRYAFYVYVHSDSFGKNRKYQNYTFDTMSLLRYQSTFLMILMLLLSVLVIDLRIFWTMTN